MTFTGEWTSFDISASIESVLKETETEAKANMKRPDTSIIEWTEMILIEIFLEQILARKFFIVTQCILFCRLKINVTYFQVCSPFIILITILTLGLCYLDMHFKFIWWMIMRLFIHYYIESRIFSRISVIFLATISFQKHFQLKEDFCSLKLPVKLRVKLRS